MKHTSKSIYLFVISSLFVFSSSIAAVSIDELIAAVIRNNGSAVRAQIERGVNPNLRDEKGRTALTLAIHQQAEKTIPVLLQARNRYQCYQSGRGVPFDAGHHHRPG